MSEVTLGWGQEETSVPGRREGRAAGGPPATGGIFPQCFILSFCVLTLLKEPPTWLLFSSVGAPVPKF